MDAALVKQSLANLSTKINDLLSDETTGTPLSDNSTQECMQAIRQLSIHLQGPESYLEGIRAQPLNNTALYFALERGIIAKLNDGAPESVSTEELAQAASLDQDLTDRLMRMLVIVVGVADASGPGLYKANALSLSLRSKKLRLGFAFSQEFAIPVAAKFTDYLQAGGKIGGGSSTSPLQFAFGQDLWTLLNRESRKRQVFDQHFATTRAASDIRWCEVYPVSILTTYASGSPFLVDIGGGNGQDTLTFLQTQEGSTGLPVKCVLQDLPSSLEGLPDVLTNDERVQTIPYNFFKEIQPVKGACYYLMHDICHDYSDEDCHLLLSNTVAAMGSNSRLLIQEWVVSDSMPQAPAVSVDWTMLMFLGGGKERTWSQWQQLLNAVGLDIVKVWETNQGQAQAVIETALKAANS